MCGYGLVMLHYPEVPMPESAIKRDEMIQEYDNADEERAKKRAKTAKL